MLASPAFAGDLNADLARFIEWFPGEYDNHEQVWQEDIDEVEHRHEQIHHIFVAAAAPSLGDNTFFVQQSQGTDFSDVYRQRLYQLSIDAAEQAIRLDIYTFNDEAKYRDAHLNPAILAELKPADLSTTPGCEVYWRFNGDYFHGYMKARSCTLISKRSGKRIYITDDLRLTPDAIWIRDEAFDEAGDRVFGNPDGIHHKNRKVRYFDGWGGVNVDGPDAADPVEGEWHFVRGIRIHDEGQLVPITDANGNPTGWSIQLARLTYQDGTTRVLKLGLVDATGYTVAYSWANPAAERIGINLRWAQIGLTLKPENTAFGFDPAGASR